MGPTRSSTRSTRSSRGESTRRAAKAASIKLSASQSVRSSRMKRVVYDESDGSSGQDEKEEGSNSEHSGDEDDEEEEDEEENEVEGEEEETPKKSKSNSKKEKAEEEVNNEETSMNSKDKAPKESADEEQEDEEDEDEEGGDIRLMIEQAEDDESLQKLIQNTLGQLARDGSNPTREIVLAYVSSVCSNPSKFQTPIILKALLRLLRSSFQQGRDRSGSIEKKPLKTKTPKDPKLSTTVVVLVSNILAKVLKDFPQEKWPDDCIKVFVDDSLHTRAWVDSEKCAPFVEMIKNHIESIPSSEGVQRIVEHLNSKVNEIKKGGANPNLFKNVIQTMMDLTPIPQVRLIISANLDLWFQSSNNKNVARDILVKIARGCTSVEPHDMETVDNLLNMKFKSVSFPQLKSEVFSILVRQRPEYVNVAMKVVLSKEKMAATMKDVDNLKMMPLIFRETVRPPKEKQEKDDAVFRNAIHDHQGADTSMALAVVIQEMASIQSNIPMLKNILRKVIKSLGPEQLDVLSLCNGLMTISNTIQSLEYFSLMGDLVALILFVHGSAVKSLQVNIHEPAPTPRISLLPKSIDKNPRRMGSNLANTNPGLQRKPSKDVREKSTITPAIKAKEEICQLFAEVHRSAVNWCHEVQQLGDQLGLRLFRTVMRRILFLETPADMQTTEHDRSCFNYCRELLPLHETTIVGIAGICYYSTPEEATDILNILEAVIVRAAEGHAIRESYFQTQEQLQDYVATGAILGLQLERQDLAMHLLESGVVRGHVYDGKSVCYSELYWRASCILLILASYNPSTLGSFIWDNVPTMRCIMQMAITGRYKFPPVEPEDAKLYESFTSSTNLVEINQTLCEWENQFFQSHQLPQNQSLMVVQPAHSTARAPPLEILRKIEGFDQGLRLGLRLRKSRVKDFLMEMVDVAVSDNNPHRSWSEGPEKIWWIVEIVCEEQDTLSYLPKRCLCEMLLLACVEIYDEKMKYLYVLLVQQVPRLLSHLKECIEQNDTEVLTFFLDRLISPNLSTRRQSSYLLGLLTKPSVPSTLSKTIPSIKFDWLPELVKLPAFEMLHERIITSLENVLKRETSIETLKACFHALFDFFSHKKNLQYQLADVLGSMLTQRAAVARLLLSDLTVLNKMVDTFWAAIEFQLDPNSMKGIESASLVSLPVATNGEKIVLMLPHHVVFGIVELLCFRPSESSTLTWSYNKLVECFFPTDTTMGLLHSEQDYKCSPEHLFHLACAPHEQLMTAAIKNMTISDLWRIILSYGREPACLNALLQTLYTFVLKNPDECLKSLMDAIGKNDPSAAVHEARMHIQMYLHQECFNKIAQESAIVSLFDWFNGLQPSHAKPAESSQPKSLLSSLKAKPYPKESFTVELKIEMNKLSQRIPTNALKCIESTSKKDTDMKRAILDDNFHQSALHWNSVIATGQKKSIASIAQSMSVSENRQFVKVCLHDLFSFDREADNIEIFIQAFIRGCDITRLLPYASIILDSIWKLTPWQIRGIWSTIVRLIVQEQCKRWPEQRCIDSNRLELLYKIYSSLPYNGPATITALFHSDAKGYEECKIEKAVVQEIVMDLYAKFPYTISQDMDICQPGWQHTIPFLTKSIPSVESKVNELFTTKEQPHSVRAIALLHPLVVAKCVLNFSLSLECKPFTLISTTPIENWLLALDLVKEYILKHSAALRHVMHCMLLLLENNFDESKKQIGNKILKVIFHMAQTNYSAMVPYFLTPSLKIHWLHVLGLYDNSNPFILFLINQIETQPIKIKELNEWNLSTDQKSMEDQLETLKSTFEHYSVTGKSKIIKSLTNYLETGSLTKKTVVLICQCLLVALEDDVKNSERITSSYICILNHSKIGLREAGISFLLNYLVYCNPERIYSILYHLFNDDSDIGKSTISQYLKSELFKVGKY